MILDRALEGHYLRVLLMIGRDRSGGVQVCHRYVLAGGGKDVSPDLPWRRPGAPNGIDERLSVDMIDWARERGAERLSLAFAAFPEIFDDQERGALQRLFYVLIHLGDRLIRLESVLGTLTAAIPSPWRVAWIDGWLTVALVVLAATSAADFTAVGHTVALIDWGCSRWACCSVCCCWSGCHFQPHRWPLPWGWRSRGPR